MLFAQDDIKVTPKLTVNLGVRYDYGRPREEARGFLRGFDPDTANPGAGGRQGAIVGAIGQGGLQAANFGLVNPDRTNFGPRVGFAYSVNDKTRRRVWIYYAPVVYNDFGNTGFRLQSWCRQHQWWSRLVYHSRELSVRTASQSERPGGGATRPHRSGLFRQEFQDGTHRTIQSRHTASIAISVRCSGQLHRQQRHAPALELRSD